MFCPRKHHKDLAQVCTCCKLLFLSPVKPLLTIQTMCYKKDLIHYILSSGKNSRTLSNYLEGELYYVGVLWEWCCTMSPYQTTFRVIVPVRLLYSSDPLINRNCLVTLTNFKIVCTGMMADSAILKNIFLPQVSRISLQLQHVHQKVMARALPDLRKKTLKRKQGKCYLLCIDYKMTFTLTSALFRFSSLILAITSSSTGA